MVEVREELGVLAVAGFGEAVDSEFGRGIDYKGLGMEGYGL